VRLESTERGDEHTRARRRCGRAIGRRDRCAREIDLALELIARPRRIGRQERGSIDVHAQNLAFRPHEFA
jgi:hypothetical protein